MSFPMCVFYSEINGLAHFDINAIIKAFQKTKVD